MRARRVVIPASSGNDDPIKWLQSPLKPGLIQHPGNPSWIPACAGMTTSREKAGCHPDNPFAMPDQCLTPARAVI